MKPSTHFSDAIADYLYLLERNYPTKSMLKLVGDRYALPSHERVMMYRGLAKQKVLAKRERKKSAFLLPRVPVAVDGFNVCRTVGSYLSGNFVFEGLDGFFRDVSEIHRKKLGWEILERSLRFIIRYLKDHQAGYVYFYFDKPLSHSGEMAALCLSVMNELALSGEAETVFSPDHCLIEVSDGLICTADSHVIDTAKVSTFDLARNVLEKYFQTKIFSLREFV